MWYINVAGRSQHSAEASMKEDETMKYNKSEIMRMAWIEYRESNACAFLIPMTFRQCLTAAWDAAKYLNDLK